MTGTKIYNGHEFREYLYKFTHPDVFDCRHLRVLSQDELVELEGEVKTYEQGSFICIQRLGSSDNARCISHLTINKDVLEVLCGWNEKSRFVLNK